jgi:hypothetical protein
VAALAGAAALAGCGGSGHTSNVAAIPIAIVSQRYTAAADPANAALTSLVKRALAYGGGSTADLDAAVSATAAVLKTAAGRVGAIAAPQPLRADIVDVAGAMNVVAGDLTPLRAARGNDVSPAIARFVADAGREAAADNLVRVLIVQITTPTTEAPPTIAAPSTTTTTPAPTTAPRRTTTTRPRTTTTRATTTTTLKH